MPIILDCECVLKHFKDSNKIDISEYNNKLKKLKECKIYKKNKTCYEHCKEMNLATLKNGCNAIQNFHLYRENGKCHIKISPFIYNSVTIDYEIESLKECKIS